MCIGVYLANCKVLCDYHFRKIVTLQKHGMMPQKIGSEQREALPGLKGEFTRTKIPFYSDQTPKMDFGGKNKIKTEKSEHTKYLYT